METVKRIEGENTVGVLSDTHIPSRASEIPDDLIENFRNREVDLIIHAGDLVSSDVREKLKDIAPLVAVSGNMDPHELSSELPDEAVVDMDGNRVGVVHRIDSPSSDSTRLFAESNDLDMLVFGHTHMNFLEEVDGVKYLNPGSPTQPRGVHRSYAILDVEEGRIEPKIINIEK